MLTMRTPDERFEQLPDYGFKPNYLDISDTEIGKFRVHYLDEGPGDAYPILLLHGEPSWSYLYRHMIPPLVAAGHRVVVPDQVGFGKSDKPIKQDDYTYARHIAWMSELLFDRLDLANITIFGQDWGGLIGLRLVAAHPDRFDRIVVANTGLPTGKGEANEAFLAWQKFAQTSAEFDVGRIVQTATVRDLSDDEVAAYNAPFPNDDYLAGARVWPSLVPTSTSDPESMPNALAWEVLERWDKPLLCLFSDQDPITAGGDRPFLDRVPGAEGQPHRVMSGGHFLQEDCGTELAAAINDFIDANPVSS